MLHSLLSASPKETPAHTTLVYISAFKNSRKIQFSILNISLIIYHLTIFIFWLMTLGFWGKVGYEWKCIREENATLKTKYKLQTFTDFHCVSPHKSNLKSSLRHTHTFISSSAVFLAFLCAYKSD